MQERYGVIDLGTNTFHILIVEVDEDDTLREIHRESRFVKLAENGIKTIGAAPYQRGLETLVDYKDIIDRLEVKKGVALGTAALRTASNGIEFIQRVREITGINPLLITGKEEARLIHNGVQRAVPLTEEKSLIMDIGGGSVEFIVADKKGIIWSDSFPVGVAVLYNDFHRHNPITEEEIERINQHLQVTLQPLLKELEQHRIKNLIGASGTFDVLEQVLVKDKPHPNHAHIDAAFFYPYYNKIIPSTIEERLHMEHLPATRADMIVVALVLIKFILEVADIRQITTSAYAMKEGLIYDLIDREY